MFRVLVIGFLLALGWLFGKDFYEGAKKLVSKLATKEDTNED